VLAVLAIETLGCSADADAPVPLDARVGRIVPRSGSLEQSGWETDAAQLLAQDEINTEGGILGHELEFGTLDSESDRDVARRAAEELIADGRSVILGAVDSDNTRAVLEVTRPASLLVLNAASTDPDLSQQSDPGSFFRTAPTEAAKAERIARAMRDAGSRLVAIASNDEQRFSLSSDSLAATLDTLFCGQPSCTSVRMDYPHDANFRDYDFAQALAPLAAERPDAYYVNGQITDGVGFLLAARQAGHEGFYYVGDRLVAGNAQLVLPPDLSARVRWVRPKPPAGPSYDYFREAFEAQYSVTPTALACQSYDAVVLLALAMVRTGSSDRETLAVALRDVSSPPGKRVHAGEFAEAARRVRNGENIDYEGVSGPVDFDESGNVSLEQALFGFEDDRPIRLD
jgi:branched-chain amino acid transport system substrate-binding protein